MVVEPRGLTARILACVDDGALQRLPDRHPPVEMRDQFRHAMRAHGRKFRRQRPSPQSLDFLQRALFEHGMKTRADRFAQGRSRWRQPQSEKPAGRGRQSRLTPPP